MKKKFLSLFMLLMVVTIGARADSQSVSLTTEQLATLYPDNEIANYFDFVSMAKSWNDASDKTDYQLTAGTSTIKVNNVTQYQVAVPSGMSMFYAQAIGTSGNGYFQFRWDTSKAKYGLFNFGNARTLAIAVTKGQIVVMEGGYTATAAGSCAANYAAKSGYNTFTATEDGYLAFSVSGACVRALAILNPSASAVDYTLNYINGELAVKSVNGELAVGESVPTDASFFVEDTKYIRKAGEPESFTIAESGNNFSVKVRPAETFNYSLLSSLGETLTSGSGLEGEKVYAGYPRYQLSEGKFYEAAITNKEYRKPIVLSEDNVNATVDYAEWNGSNTVVFYAEGENIDGFTVSTAGNVPVRASNAKAGTAAEDVAITSLPAGKYKLHVGIFTSASSGYADKVVNFGVGSETFAAAFTGVNLNEVASDEITVAENSDVKFIAEGAWTGAQFDYIWIEKTGEYVPVVTSYTVTISDEIENGTVAADPTSAKVGDEVTLTNTPAEGYEFVSYSVTCKTNNKAVIVTDGKFTMPADDVTVSATFQLPAPVVYAVKIAESVGGTVETSAASAEAGAEVTITATPAEGYELDDISVKDVASDATVTVTDGKFIMPEYDVLVTATFKEKVVPPTPAGTYDLTLAEGSEAHGTVTFTIGGNEVTKADKDDDVTVSVAPAEGFVVKNVTARAYTSWENAARATSRNITDAPALVDNIEVAKQEDGTWKFTMPDGNVLVQVEYEAVYAVTIAEDIVGGTVVADPTSAKAGDEVTLTNTPAEGYEFVSYSVTCKTNNEAVIVTDGKFTMPADTVTVSALFTKQLQDAWIEGIADQTYTGEAIEPVIVVKDGETTLVENTDYTVSYSDNIVAGTATVTVTAKEGSEKYSGTASKTFVINKADITMTTAPAAVENLVYSKEAQTLITAGVASFGTVLYSIDKDNYSAELPQATAAGTYTVYYKVDGDDNHNALAPQSIDVTIATNKSELITAIPVAEEYYARVKDLEPGYADNMEYEIGVAKGLRDNPDADQTSIDVATGILEGLIDGAKQIVAWKPINIIIPAKSYVARIDADKRQMHPINTVEGVSFYSVKSVTGNEVELTSALTVVDAEMPYLIYNDNDEEKIISIVVSEDPADAVEYDSDHFKGTLEGKTFTEEDMKSADHYVLQNGNSFVWVKDAGTLAAGKCWIERVRVLDNPARSLRIVAEGQITGIDAAPAAGNGIKADGKYLKNGKIIIIKNGKEYNAIGVAK